MFQKRLKNHKKEKNPHHHSHALVNSYLSQYQQVTLYPCYILQQDRLPKH